MAKTKWVVDPTYNEKNLLGETSYQCSRLKIENKVKTR